MMITSINESKTLTKQISCDFKSEVEDKKWKSNQKWNKDKCWCECKNSIKHKCKQDYAYNPPTCACECDKNCDIDEYFKNCACE